MCELGQIKQKLFDTKVEALEWEVAERKADWEATTDMVCSLKDWAEKYFNHARKYDRKIYYAKRQALREFFTAKISKGKAALLIVNPLAPVPSLTSGKVLAALRGQFENRSGNAANKHRKNLVVAWNWGIKYLGPSTPNPYWVERFPKKRCPRYIPSEKDFWKVYAQTQGQDRVMLLVYLHFGARRSEVFQKLEERHKVGRSSRRFGFKEQFTVMAFIQLAARRSLRDGLRALTTAGKRLYHLGLGSVARSTVADANNSRPVDFFKALFEHMYVLCTHKAPSHKFRFKAKLYSLDATTISLCLSLFPWASFRQNKGGVKMNTLLDHDGHIPAFASIDTAKTHESPMVKSLSLPKGSIVTFDKGYINYAWFQLLCEKGLFFVTRLKDNAKYKIVERRPVNRKTGVTSDHIINVTYKKTTLLLRRVGYRDAETGNHNEFLTNHFRLSPKTITNIYKER